MNNNKSHNQMLVAATMMSDKGYAESTLEQCETFARKREANTGMKHDFADGKYTVISNRGELTALRNGEPWARDLIGDNLVYWMLVRVDELTNEVAELKKNRIEFMPGNE
jgi:hypothetical protein